MVEAEVEAVDDVKEEDQLMDRLIGVGDNLGR